MKLLLKLIINIRLFLKFLGHKVHRVRRTHWFLKERTNRVFRLRKTLLSVNLNKIKIKDYLNNPLLTSKYFKVKIKLKKIYFLVIIIKNESKRFNKFYILLIFFLINFYYIFYLFIIFFFVLLLI